MTTNMITFQRGGQLPNTNLSQCHYCTKFGELQPLINYYVFSA